MKRNKKMPKPFCNMDFSGPIARWDEAIPLGNGMIGCLLWGNGSPLRMGLDRGILWDNRQPPETLSEKFNYQQLIRMAGTRDKAGIEETFENFCETPFPCKIPAGGIELNFAKACRQMRSKLDIARALAVVTLNYGDTSATVRTFLHAASFIGYICVEGEFPRKLISVVPPDYGGKDGGDGARDSLQRLGFPEARVKTGDGFLWFCQKTKEDLEYAVIVCQKTTPGRLEAVYTVAASPDGENWLEDAKARLQASLDQGFEAALRGHRKWWSGFWRKSAVTLPDKALEKMWYTAVYFLGACSRRGFPPMPLQGLWTADDGKLPPWKGDYHNDLNTQMSYWHCMKANHSGEGLGLIDFLWSLAPKGRHFAKTFFDAPGIAMPGVMSIEGNPMAGWAMYSFNLTNQIWLCQIFEHYWSYQRDGRFLRERAYPYFKETAACVLRWLRPEQDNKLALPLSASPEVHDNTLDAWMTPNSNFDLCLLIYLFQTLAEMAEILNNGEHKMWRKKLDQLPGIAVTEDGVLRLSPKEELTKSHRHFSHCMAIYPLKLLEYDRRRDKEIIDATISSLEELGTGLWVGYSFAWMACLYSVQRNGEAAAHMLKTFWENFCSANGFHLNGDYRKRGISRYHYRPFTLEGNMGAACALQEMLLQTTGGSIVLFPAIPKAWQTEGVSFDNLRAETGVLVSARMQNREVSYVTLRADETVKARLCNPFGTNRIQICKGGEYAEPIRAAGAVLEVSLTPGKSVTITRDYENQS